MKDLSIRWIATGLMTTRRFVSDLNISNVRNVHVPGERYLDMADKLITDRPYSRLDSLCVCDSVNKLRRHVRRDFNGVIVTANFPAEG